MKFDDLVFREADAIAAEVMRLEKELTVGEDDLRQVIFPNPLSILQPARTSQMAEKLRIICLLAVLLDEASYKSSPTRGHCILSIEGACKRLGLAYDDVREISRHAPKLRLLMLPS